MLSAAQIVAVVGPTASGKSRLAVELAERLGSGEVVNADSMQLYRGMDIGTAKPSAAERERVPHHLFDLLDIDQPASVAEFQTWARSTIDECHARGATPILVGGSALYVRAVLDRLDFPGTDPAVRARLTEESERLGFEAMHERLTALDPAAAAAILATNGRRIVRALEVIELTGEPFTATMPGHDSIYPGLVMLGLDVPRPELDVRLTARVDHMWDEGFVAEVERLAGEGLAHAPTASSALGYQQILAFLNGECSEADAREATVVATRKFARRQDRLFRQDPRIQWLKHDAADLIATAEALLT